MATQYTAGLTTGQVLTAATMNSIGAAWETYTPTFTNLVASGIVSKYTRINKLVIWQIAISVSSGTAGEIGISLPITALASNLKVGYNNFATFFDSSASDSYIMSAYIPTTTVLKLFFSNSTTPTIWDGSQVGISDELNGTFIYEAA